MDKLNFDRDWRFYLGENPQNQGITGDDAGWEQVDLPHDWSIGLDRDPQQASGAAGGYFPTGRGWYRKSLDVPEEWRGKEIWIEFEGVYMNSEVWLNGHFVGRQPYGYTSFYYDLTPYLNIGAANLVRVFVDNSCQPNSRWYSGSGIYRHVWLRVGNPIHIPLWGISIATPEVSAAKSSVAIHTRIENETNRDHQMTVRWRILSDDGSVIASAQTTVNVNGESSDDFRQSIEVPHPRLWSPDEPSLYQLETEVLVTGQVVDSSSTTFGIRRLDFDARQGFRLNGRPTKLKGACLHHDNGILGAASYDRAEERKVELLKASGFNALRCAHNPPAPAFLDACDRLGMLVIDEAFDCWQYPKNPGDYHTAFDDWWQRDIDSMVRRDRNHASIIMWSIGNEIPERGWPEGVELGRRLTGHIRALDPSRPVTSAVCEAWQQEWDWPQTKDFFAILDAGGYNYQWAQYGPDHASIPRADHAGNRVIPDRSLRKLGECDRKRLGHRRFRMDGIRLPGRIGNRSSPFRRGPRTGISSISLAPG